VARASPQVTPGERVRELVERMRAEDLRRYPDASWTDLRDALGRGFAPPMDSLERAHVLDGGPGAGPGLVGRFVDGYGQSAARYGKTGSPVPPGPGAPGVTQDSTPAAARAVAVAGALGSPERSELAQAIDGLSLLPGPNAPAELAGALVAVVAVRLDAAGAVTDVRLVGRSGSPGYDRAVLETAQQVLGRRLSRRLAGTVTEWAFATEVRVQPVAPGVAFTFDDALRPQEGFLPLQRRVRTRIELRAIRPG
jgi:TonB family protein